ncbi:hypothetical protein V6U81_10280 [Micromonospora sp. CPCC 205711]|uniref:hypothetical protein n=1 Tax=Micromonospora sp. CPCC 205547 TaxID=3122400 RepID=UPI002FF20E19
MAKHRRPLADDPSTGEGAPDVRATYWSVAGCPWPTVSPTLPADMVDLLASPIVVGVARVPVTSRATPPGAVAARPTAAGGGAVRTLGPAGTAPAGRPAPAPGPTGRHRRARGTAERG